MTSDQAGKAGAPPSANTPAGESAPDKAGRSSATSSYWAQRGWSIAALSSAISILWAAYTYSDQQAEQRRQDFLQAYNLVDGDLGQSVVGTINAAIEPFIAASPITDREWIASRTCYDELAADIVNPKCLVNSSENPAAAEQRTFKTMQTWILTHVLVKDGRHDDYIHNYQYAKNNLIFLYRYAAADPCNWAVIALKFKKNAYDFWYYYPGSYDFSGPQITPLPQPPETAIYSDDQEKEQAKKCLQDFTSIPQKILDPILEPLRRIL